jgi:hypothetical protein
VGEIRNTFKIIVGKPEGKTTRKTYIGVDAWIILKWILGNRVGECRLDSSRSG